MSYFLFRGSRSRNTVRRVISVFCTNEFWYVRFICRLQGSNECHSFQCCSLCFSTAAVLNFSLFVDHCCDFYTSSCISVTCHSSYKAAWQVPEITWQLNRKKEIFVKSHSTYGILPYPTGRGSRDSDPIVLAPILLADPKSGSDVNPQSPTTTFLGTFCSNVRGMFLIINKISLFNKLLLKQIKLNALRFFLTLRIFLLFKVDQIIVRSSKEHKKLRSVDMFRLLLIVWFQRFINLKFFKCDNCVMTFTTNFCLLYFNKFKVMKLVVQIIEMFCFLQNSRDARQPFFKGGTRKLISIKSSENRRRKQSVRAFYVKKCVSCDSYFFSTHFAYSIKVGLSRAYLWKAHLLSLNVRL